jgi:hypothetical protein
LTGEYRRKREHLYYQTKGAWKYTIIPNLRGRYDVGHCFRLRLRMRVGGGLHDIQGYYLANTGKRESI